MSSTRVLETLRSLDPSLLSDDGTAVRLVIAGSPEDSPLRVRALSPLGEAYEVSLTREHEKVLEPLLKAADRLTSMSLAERAESLAEAADYINSNFEIMTRLVALETGKSLSQAREEVSATAELLSRPLQLLEQLPQISPPVTSLAQGPWRASWVQPVRGPTLVLASFSSPLFTAAAGAAFALLSSSPAVVKSPWQGAASAAAALSAIASTDLTDFVSLVHHRGPPLLDGIGQVVAFGRPETVQAAARQYGVPVYYNCSGRALTLICSRPDDIEALARDLIESAAWHAGQGCGSIRWVLARNDIAEELAESAADMASQMTVGDPLEGADVGPLRHRGLVDVAVRLINDAIAKGASQSGELEVRGNWVRPLVLSNVLKAADLVWRDVFAPVMAIMSFTDCSEALNTAKLMTQATTAVAYWDLSRAVELASSRSIVTIAGREGAVDLARVPCYAPPSQLQQRPSLLLF